MSVSRFNRNNRKAAWRASGHTFQMLQGRLTRQTVRAAKRARAWAMMSGVQALRDERGVIPRRVRRHMALQLAKTK
jgi:hypothetical protein